VDGLDGLARREGGPGGIRLVDDDALLDLFEEAGGAAESVKNGAVLRPIESSEN
jgi:hypothetical protein